LQVAPGQIHGQGTAEIVHGGIESHAMKQRVSVVIVNWNGKTDTAACLDSLRKVVVPKSLSMSVVVVDNGSVDGSEAFIRGKYPEVAVIGTGKNLGFSGGNNAGIRYALDHGADYVWMLNNDTVVDPKVLSFLTAFDNPSVGAVGSKIFFAPGHEFHHDRYSDAERGRVIWYAGGMIDWNNMYASHRGVDEIDHGQYDTVEDTPFITGCSMAVRRETVNAVGMLDDAYYLYLEDVDLNLRIQRAGYRTLYVPSSVVWHVNAGSSGKPGNPLHEYYFTRNRMMLGMKYAPLRTRSALIREAVRFFLSGSPIRRRAIRDWFLGNVGKQYEPQRKTAH
jgi:GT2 family glycosyltransferase